MSSSLTARSDRSSSTVPVRRGSECLGARRSTRSDRSISGGVSVGGGRCGCALSISSSVLSANCCDGERRAGGRGSSVSGESVRGWKHWSGPRTRERSDRRGIVRKLRGIASGDRESAVCVRGRGETGGLALAGAPGPLPLPNRAEHIDVEEVVAGVFANTGTSRSKSVNAGSDAAGECLRNRQSRAQYMYEYEYIKCPAAGQLRSRGSKTSAGEARAMIHSTRLAVLLLLCCRHVFSMSMSLSVSVSLSLQCMWMKKET